VLELVVEMVLQSMKVFWPRSFVKLSFFVNFAALFGMGSVELTW